MKSEKFFIFVVSTIAVVLISCSDNATLPDLKNDIAGKWLLTRTLVRPNPDFPNGY